MSAEFLKDGGGLSILVLDSNPQSAVHSLFFASTQFGVWQTLPWVWMLDFSIKWVAHNLEFNLPCWFVTHLYHTLIQLLCSYFISIRVRSLFLWRPGNTSSPRPSFFSFKVIIDNSKMKVRIYFIWPKKVMKGNKTITWVCNQTNPHQMKMGEHAHVGM